MTDLVTIEDVYKNCYTITKEFKKTIDKHSPKGAEIAESFDKIRRLVWADILERFKAGKMLKVHEHIAELWREFDASAPIIRQKDVIYVLLHENAKFDLYEQHTKLAQKLADDLNRCFNIQDWPGSKESPEYETLYDLTYEAFRKLIAYKDEVKHFITLLGAIRRNYEKGIELENLKLEKARAEVSNLKNQDEALELILKNLDSLRKDLIDLKNNPQKDQAEVTKKVYALFNSFTLFSGFNVDLSANGVKNEITLGKIGP